MVRISGGIYKGRRLQVPHGTGVRPTKDLVREALFSVLGDSIAGRTVVDLFAGSGVVGLEALSRGAARAVWVEKDPAVFSVLKRNVAAAAGEEVLRDCFRSDAFAWLRSPVGDRDFDMVFADPPYERSGGEGWAAGLLDALYGSVRLKADGLLVMEQRSSQPVIDNPRWNRLKDSKYGDTRLIYYRRAAA
jgi:16S rRNA (guanine966-N2)-methyltransferase